MSEPDSVLPIATQEYAEAAIDAALLQIVGDLSKRYNVSPSFLTIPVAMALMKLASGQLASGFRIRESEILNIHGAMYHGASAYIRTIPSRELDR